jgi:hypothetical protein
LAECADLVDNDGDGFVDWFVDLPLIADPDCTGPFDTSEAF